MVKNSFGQNLRAANQRQLFFATGLIGCVIFAAGCSRKPIVTVKEEAEAIEIVDVLREYDLTAEKETVTENNLRQYEVFVHGDTFGGESANSAAYQILRAHCLPQTDPPIIESSTLGSPQVEIAKIQRQQKMSIVAQLRKLPGATCVDVNYVLPQDPIVTVEPYPARASVTLHHKIQDIPYNDVEIKGLVSGMVTKLSSENVTVKFIYQPIAAPEKAKSGNLTRLLLIGGGGLVIILGSVLLVYFLQKSRQGKSEALVEQTNDLDAAETVES